MNIEKKTKTILILVLLLLLFILPLFLATILYVTKPNWLHHHSHNKRQFMSEALTFKQLKMQKILSKPKCNTWQLIYFATSACQAKCQKHLYRLNKVIIALGKKSSQIQLVLLQTIAPSTKIDPLLEQLKIPIYELNKQINREFMLKLHPSTSSDGIYLVDAQQRFIFYYPTTAVTQTIYQDLIHLLH